ncbi:MAG: tRNA pseudouridine(55) synthase TruB [Betaproteobacteria bacterium]|nr:tRNA pseudouridine(55) synthase TruB [Betaproteobacteria bacterium]
MPNTPSPESRRAVTGVFLLDKPFGLSSNAALQRVRRLFHAQKAGHTGTLDPHATGLLAICLGEATKFSGWLLDAPKTYLAQIRLGYTSSTGDGEGEIVRKHPFAGSVPELQAVLKQFEGIQVQRPPMHSALKVEGRPLYSYARAGLEVPRAERRIEVLTQRMEGWDGETLSLSVTVSKGTYIRVLAQDIGEALGCGGYLTGLRRTGAGPFTLDSATTLEALESLDPARRDALLLPADTLLQGMPRLELDDAQSMAVQRGQRPACSTSGLPGQRFRVYSPANRFLGICELTTEQRLHPARMMAGD